MKSLVWSQPVEITIILAVLVAAVLLHSGVLVVISFILFNLFFLFYRIPRIEVGPGIVSPATGTIARVRKRSTEVIIEIFLSLLNPHVQIVPVDGIVLESTYVPGPNVDARLPTDNREQWITRIRFRDGIVSVVQNTGVVARRLENYCSRGQQVRKGNLLGLIKFGSRVDLCVPHRFGRAFRLQEGDKVRMGESLFL